MRVHLGSDHAGLDLKNHLLTWLDSRGHEVIDHGAFVYDSADDYPVFCLRAAEAVAADHARDVKARGVVIGGSGNGEQIAANKVSGVRAALAWSEVTAALAREHNDANVIAVGARMHPVDDTARFIEIFLAAAFSDDERHVRRITQMAAYETTGELPPLPQSAMAHRSLPT